MKSRRVALILAGLVLTGCDHHENAAEPPAAADSAYTGVPAANPRATPANLPPPPAPSVPKPVPPPTVAVTSVRTDAEPAPRVPAPDASELAANAPASPEPAPPLPEPAPSAAPIETTPPTPTIATLPPRPMDDAEAKEQVVVLQTSFGNMVIELDDVAAPRTCGNFRKLVSNGFYNHTLFHRVIPNFMIQGGDPNSRMDDRRTYGLGDPGYTLPAEIKLKHVAGAVAMARLPDATNPQRESNGSQFYICVTDCPSLDGQYTVFGHLIRGLDAAAKIAGQPRDKNNDPIDRIEMQASIETKQQAIEENPR